MKKIIIIDSINDERSIEQIDHLCEVLNLEKINNLQAICRKRNFEMKTIHLPSMEFDPDEIQNADAVVFSGSVKSVFEDFAWKNKMTDLFLLLIEKKKPVLAICFGAQFLAHVLGKNVIKNPNGIEFGPVKVELTEEGKVHPYLKDLDDKHYVFATHEDSIETLPDDAVLLAFNQNTAIQAFQYGNIFATQFHIDLPTSRTRKLLEGRKEKYLNCGFLKNEDEFNSLYNKLHLGEYSHRILNRFIDKIIG